MGWEPRVELGAGLRETSLVLGWIGFFDSYLVKVVMRITEQEINKKTKEYRQQEALLVAEQCAEMLRQRFGARTVIPFGSLVGDGPWHEGSDLDQR